ncbi:MAG: U32 family peptidase [Rikenellaceae bacterium]
MKIELLAPAGDTVIGRAALDAGADAVYIGGPAFGARRSAGNSMEDIASLVEYAHGFGARVYLAMNTILFDDELEEARKVAVRAWEIGVDALIVQDLAYLEMDLPPIDLHSSTQMFNKTPQKVLRAQQMGFSRVVLERAMTLDEIRSVRSSATVELEAFIHGAICVGYSGQCYLSEALCSRGGNRGGCAQSCRSRYDLYDLEGRLLERGGQLLSVGDMMLGDRISDLIASGVCSLKIEGRLKDRKYVVNNVAYYDDILRGLGVERVSRGRCERNFAPNPHKSFSRESTVYFLDNPRARVSSSSKSLGERIGRVVRVRGDRFEVDGDLALNNGDGLCWALNSGDVVGSNVNYCMGRSVGLNGMTPSVGDLVYRNFDKKFDPRSSRFIDVRFTFGGGRLEVSDGEHCCGVDLPEGGELAKNREMMGANIIRAMSKSGGTIFRVVDVVVSSDQQLIFMAASQLNSLRGELLDKLLQLRLASYSRREQSSLPCEDLAVSSLDYRANVSNSMSRKYYMDRGVRSISDALEVGGSLVDREVLRTRFCLRRELGLCRGGSDSSSLILENNGKRLRADFDCEVCEMSLVYLG